MRKWFLSLFKKTESGFEAGLKQKFKGIDNAPKRPEYKPPFHGYDLSDAEYTRRVKAGIIKEGCQKDADRSLCSHCGFGKRDCPLANIDVSPKD